MKSKRSNASPAEDLYTSAMFEGGRRAVEATCDRWYILSAKHGLLDPETVIEPYDETLATAARQRRRDWSAEVLADLRAELGDLGPHTYEIHAGKAYYDHGLRRDLEQAGAQVVVPTEGMAMGRKLAFYSSGAAKRAVVTRAGDPKASAERAGPMTPPRSSRAVTPPTGKYRPLFEHLEGLTTDRWEASFAKIEHLLGSSLPHSARRHPAWWANESASHSHARAWLAAGYRTSRVRLPAEQVTFQRGDR